MKLKKETLRWPRGQDKITSRCVHALGFVYGKQEEMAARVVVPSSCHPARRTASLCGVCCRKILPKITRYLSLFYFSHVENFRTAPKCTLFHKLSMFFPYIPSCETHKQFGAEPAQYGLEINFKYSRFQSLRSVRSAVGS